MHSSSPQDSDKKLAVKSETYYTTEGSLGLSSVCNALLTATDVQFLHEVVAHAQDLLPDLPERERVPTSALFTAYYALLPNVGIDADHDSRYARILFKIGGTRSPGSLFEKFETVLSQMGIDLEFIQEFDEDVQEHVAHKHMDESLSLQIESSPQDKAVLRPHGGRQRRNSEGSVRNTGKYSSTLQDDRSLFQSAHEQSGSGITSATRPISASFTDGIADHDIYEIGQGIQDLGQTRDVRQRLTPDDPDYGLLFRSGLSHESMRIRHQSPPLSEYDSKTTSTWHGSNEEDAALASLAQTAPTSKAADSEMDFVPVTNHYPEALIDKKASLVDKYRANNLLKYALTQWRKSTVRIQEDGQNLELLATHQDKQVLVRQAFDSWQSKVRTGQQAIETESFFAHLELRADRARDYMILSKAYLHWAASAYDESLRTSVARRHILRMRYFEAWRGLTAINELKVRRQVLRKFFTVWYNRYNFNSADATNVLAIFEGNLAYRVFSIWLRMLQQREAVAWCARRIKHENFTNWTRATYHVELNKALALHHGHRKVKTTALRAWIAENLKYGRNRVEANEHRKYTVGYKILRQFGLEYSLSSPAHRLNALVALRLKRNIVAIWLERARQERLATVIDHTKIKREAWVSWNNKFRCCIINAHKDRRLLRQGFRAWMLLERATLSDRLLNRRLAQNSLHLMLTKSQVLVHNDTGSLYIINKFARKNLSTKALLAWHVQSQLRAQQQIAAFDFNSPRLLRDCLARWMASTKQNMQMLKWARDGEFYFLASKTLKLWKDATIKSKREKRRTAYVDVRRKNKSNLATSIILLWRRRTDVVVDIDRLAADSIHNKTMVFGASTVTRWRSCVKDIRELESMSKDTQIKKHLDKLRTSFSARQDLEGEAAAVFSEQNLSLGIKLWTRAALHLRASKHFYSELRQKYSRKTVRKIFLHWRQRTSDNMSLSALERQSMAFGYNKATLGPTERAEGWSEFEVDPGFNEWARKSDNDSPASIIPGYLSTPSRRISRARAFGGLPSTTPVALLSTPFEKQLRAQYSGSALNFQRTIQNTQHGKSTGTVDRRAPAGRDSQQETNS